MAFTTKNDIDWILEGEDQEGTNPSTPNVPDGVSNRPRNQIHDNTLDNRARINELNDLIAASIGGTFLSLPDTPPTYPVGGDFALRVKADETGVEWVDVTNGYPLIEKSYIIGGDYLFGAGSFLSTNQAYNPAADSFGLREPIIAPEAERSGCASTLLNNLIFLFGGYTETPSLLSSNLFYNALQDQWTASINMVSTIRNQTASTVLEKAYLFGGGTSLFPSGSQTNQNLEFDPSTVAYTAKDPIPLVSVEKANSSTYNDKAYVLGGGAGVADFTGAVNTNQTYDPSLNSWTANTSIPTIIYGHAQEVLGTTLYVIAGHNATQTLSTNYGYNLVLDSWTSYAGLPPQTIYLVGESPASGAHGDNIHLFGGSADGLTALSYQPIYDSNGDSWSQGTTLAQATFEATATKTG